MNAGISSIVASKSLELTRATQRPFLNVDQVSCYIYKTSIGRITAYIYSKGVFPADDVSVDCEVRRIRGNSEENLSLPAESGKTYPSVYFPEDDMAHFFEKSGGIPMEQDDRLRVYITISYKNKLTEETHTTVRAYSLTFTPGDRNEILSPYPQGDYWD